MFRRTAPEQRAQALIIMALAMVVLVGFLALAVDGANAYAQRRLVQNAADAGALAGARALAVGESPEAAAVEYAVGRNGADWAEVTVQGQTVTVVAGRSFPSFFARVLGWPTMSAGGQATAGYGRPRVMRGQGFFPVAVHSESFQVGQSYQIWDDDKEPDDPPEGVIVGGNRGWLNFNGGNLSNAELKEWVREGYTTTLTAGACWINGDPGTRASALHEAKEHRIGDTVIMVVYDGVREGQEGNGQLDYHVISFAAFIIESVEDTGEPKWIEGEFVRYVTAGPPLGLGDHGVIAIALTQ